MSVQSVIDGVDQAMRVRVASASRFVQAQAKTNFTLKGPGPPSVPGEYPAVQTGALVESVTVEYDPDGLGSTIGPNVEYAKFLIRRDRKLMRETLAENISEVNRILVGGA